MSGAVHVLGLEGRELELVRAALAGQFEMLPDVDASVASDEVVAVVHAGSEQELNRWAKLRPRVARVWLTDPETSREAITRGGVAHTYLHRPITVSSVQAVVDQALSLQTLLMDDAIRELVEELGTLPAQPRTYQALCVVLASSSAGAREAAEVIERDVVVSASVLRMVNSSMYGLPRQVASLPQAVGMLGMQVVQDLALTVEVLGQMVPATPIPGVNLEEMQTTAHVVGSVARALVGGGRADQAYMVGLFSALGQMALASKAPDRYLAATYLLQTDLTIEEALASVFGVRSLDLAAWMLAMWGLPWEVVDGVRTCDTHAAPEGGPIPLSGAVKIATCLVEEVRSMNTEQPMVLVTREMLEPWGLQRRLPVLRGLARSLGRGLEEPPPRRAPPVRPR